MIIKCNNENKDVILQYIGEDYGKCLYLYIDLIKYGLENENFHIWIQYDEEKICCLISQYYNGIQIYSKNYDLNANEIVEFILKKEPHIISGMDETIEKIKKFFPKYSEEVGVLGELSELIYPSNLNAYSASFDEMDEIARILSKDEVLGEPYGYELLYTQFCERKKDKFGRNFILRDSSTNEIICHAATYAELPELAVISGVLTTPKYRGKGFSKGVLSAICNELQSEDKRVFSYFYIVPAEKMHYGVGFEKRGEWIKLVKH